MHFNPEFGTKHLDPCDFSLCVLLSLRLFVFLFSFLPLAQNSEEVCILSASGTAAILNPRYMREGCLDIGCTDHRLVSFFSYCSAQSLGQSECQSSCVYDNAPFWSLLFSRFEEPSPPNCGFCHIPYDELNMPFPAQLTYCYHCRRQKVSNTVNFFLG